MSQSLAKVGYFLDFVFWENAVSLLGFQLSMKQGNRHFNKLSMFYYENLTQTYKRKVATQKYFTSKVENNLFYGLQNEFSIHSYPIPKANLGLRKYCFFTYPARVLCYSVGLYIVKLSQDFLQEHYFPHSQINSYYGGSLKFDSSQNKVVLKYDSVWYKKHYQDFRRQVRKHVQDEKNKKVVIHLDIQNYYEEIQVRNLVELLDHYVKPSIKKEMRFDAITQEQILNLFEYFTKKETGIPQFDNDITCSYIGYLYLVFADLRFDEELRKNSKDISTYFIDRYMDDIYITIEFSNSLKPAEQEVYVARIANTLADVLYSEFGLRLNTKTQLYWLCQKYDEQKLLKSLKRTSPGYEIPDDEDSQTPQGQLDRIFKQLERLKRRSLDPTFDDRSDLDDEVLKQVYDKSVSALLQQPKNKDKIASIFDEFNFDLVIAQPREILIILMKSSESSKNFSDFLLRKTSISSRDAHLVLSYLCQEEFDSKPLIRILKKNIHMKPIIDIYSRKNPSRTKPGYFDLTEKQIARISNNPNILEQIRLRIKAERRGHYSVALNHLLNEVHAICYVLESPSKKQKKYNAKDAVKFLNSKTIPHEVCVQVGNLFDRRNKNPISHADTLAWPVDRSEYLSYAEYVSTCLSHIL